MWSLGTSSFINFSKFWAQGHPPKYFWTWAQAHSEFRICIGTHHLHSMWDRMRSTSMLSSSAGCHFVKMSVDEDVSWECQLDLPVVEDASWQSTCSLSSRKMYWSEPKTQWTKLKSTNSVMCSLQHCQDMRSKRFTAFLKTDANHAYITFANQDKSTLQSRTIFLYKPLVSFCRRRDFFSPLKWNKMHSHCCHFMG